MINPRNWKFGSQSKGSRRFAQILIPQSDQLLKGFERGSFQNGLLKCHIYNW